jgi:outer membrane autotransporter protein
VVLGAYAYGLYKNGVKDTSDGNWYLRSRFVEKPRTETDPELPAETDPDLPTVPDPELPAGTDPELPYEPHYQAGVPVYEAYAQSLLAASGLPTLAQRTGNRLWSDAQPVKNNSAATHGIWGRVEGTHSRISPRSSRTVDRSETDIRTLQAGIDGQFLENDSGSLTGGITVRYSNVSTNVSSHYGDGEINTDGYGAGSSLTFYGGDGFYLDGQAQAIWYRSDLSSALVRKGLTGRNNAFGFGFSAEAGQQLRMSENWTVTPQGQLAYSSVGFDRFTDAFGSVTASERASSLLARLGVSADYAMDWRDTDGKGRRSRSYVIANLYQELLDGSRISSAGVGFTTKSQPTWGGIGAGGSYSWADDKYRVYGELLVKTSFGDFGRSYSAGGTAGLRVAF